MKNATIISGIKIKIKKYVEILTVLDNTSLLEKEEMLMEKQVSQSLKLGILLKRHLQQQEFLVPK